MDPAALGVWSDGVCPVPVGVAPGGAGPAQRALARPPAGASLPQNLFQGGSDLGGLRESRDGWAHFILPLVLTSTPPTLPQPFSQASRALARAGTVTGGVPAFAPPCGTRGTGHRGRDAGCHLVVMLAASWEAEAEPTAPSRPSGAVLVSVLSLGPLRELLHAPSPEAAALASLELRGLGPWPSWRPPGCHESGGRGPCGPSGPAGLVALGGVSWGGEPGVPASWCVPGSHLAKQLEVRLPQEPSQRPELLEADSSP